jgi:hypothetical protein
MPTKIIRLTLMLAVVLAGAVRGDGFVDQLNEALSRIPENRRSDLIILPALAAMDEPPVFLRQRADRAALILTRSPAWSAAESWAMAAPQRAVLEALDRVTSEPDPRRAMAFALPYGINGVPTAIIRAGIHAELGDPPSIASAQLGYLERFGWLGLLVDIETTRLQASGDPNGAIELCGDLAAFARQIADRQLGREVIWAFETMTHAMRRIRDTVYVDSKGARTLTGDYLVSMVQRLDPRDGLFRLDRLRTPDGDRLGALQLVDRVFDRAGRPDPGQFPSVMAEMASTGRPLRLFAEAGRWSEELGGHAGAAATREAVEGVFGDWATRWNANPFDPLQRNVSTYRLLPGRSESYALVSSSVPDLGGLFDLRKALEAELVGTRLALAVRALNASTGGVASSLAIVRPRYVDDLGADPFNPNRAAANVPEMKFLVPERDTPGGRTLDMAVVPRARANFRITLTRDDFVIYSLGGNENDDKAVDVSDDPSSRIGDYLIWPPVLSLTRDYLTLTGASE